MKTIAITNQKGGAGKTTTVINLATELAARGKRVLVIDLDPQADATKSMAESLDHTHSVADMFRHRRKITLPGIIVPFKDATYPTLFYAPSCGELSTVIEESVTYTNRERILQKQLELVRDDFDFVLLDTPPNLFFTTLNSLVCADVYLIPVDSKCGLDGLGMLLDAIEDVLDLDDEGLERLNYFVFRNELAVSDTKINQFVQSQFDQYLCNTHVLQTKVRRSAHIEQSSAVSLPLRIYKPGSVALNDYSRLATELLERIPC